MRRCLVIKAEATSSRWKDIAGGANWLVWFVFGAEFAFILVVAPSEPPTGPDAVRATRQDSRVS